MGRSRKPRFKLSEWLTVEPFLRRMAESLRDGYGHEWWPQVASDTLDGWAYAEEVRPLVRRRILTVIDDGGCGCKHFCDNRLLSIAECGMTKPTWHLTERGLRLLAPHHPALSAPVSGEGE